MTIQWWLQKAHVAGISYFVSCSCVCITSLLAVAVIPGIILIYSSCICPTCCWLSLLISLKGNFTDFQPALYPYNVGGNCKWTVFNSSSSLPAPGALHSFIGKRPFKGYTRYSLSNIAFLLTVLCPIAAAAAASVFSLHTGVCTV